MGLVSGLAVGYFWGLETLKIEMATGPLRIIRWGTLHGAFAGFISGAYSASSLCFFTSSNQFTFLGGFIGGLIGGVPGLFLGLFFSIIIALIRINPKYNGYKVSLSEAENSFAEFLRMVATVLLSASSITYFFIPLLQSILASLLNM